MTEQQNTQENPPLTIIQLKTKVCAELRSILMRELMMERLLKMVGGDESKVAKYMTSWFGVLMQDDGSGKKPNEKYYVQCSISSLITCFLESVNMMLPFDSRKLVSMIIYDWEVELDISYKGFVNALNRHFTDAFVECKLVFEGDVFEVEIEDRIAHYKYKPKDPLANVTEDFKGIKGGYCFFSYTDTDGGKTSRLVFLSREQILKNKSRAKQHYVWNSDPKAMGEKTCIREGARLPFAAIDLEVDIEEVDNKHYKLEKPDSMLRLKNLIDAQEAEQHAAKNPDAPLGDTTKQDEGTPASKEPATEATDGTAPARGNGEATAPDDTTGGKEVVSEKPEKDPADNQVIEGDYVNVPDETPQEWDGKTVYMGNGKSISKETFSNAHQAGVYLKKIISQRTKNETRKEILYGNDLLLKALAKADNKALIEELTKTITDGE